MKKLVEKFIVHINTKKINFTIYFIIRQRDK